LEFGSHFKFRALAAGVLLLSASCDLPRDNPLDPKNPGGSRPRKIMLEAFVNLHTPSPYDAYAVDALDSLARVYAGRVVVAEFHRNVQGFTTPYHRSENEILYAHYLDAAGSNRPGLPDVFVNGIGARVQGASSLESAFFRLQQAVLPGVSADSPFSVELKADQDADGVIPTVILARVGDRDAVDLVVRTLLLARLDAPHHRRVVLGFAKSAPIPLLKHGEIQTLVLPKIASNGSRPNAVVAEVLDADERQVIQCELLQLIP
jgi:hypothetical protein